MASTFTLDSVPLFQNLPEGSLQELEKKAISSALKRKKNIFRAGEKAEFLYIVKKGMVKLFRNRKGSEKEEIVCVIRDRGHFCLAPLLTDAREHMNAAAMEESQLLLIAKKDLLDLMNSSHAFAKNLIRTLAGKECRLCEEVCDLSLSTTKERLAKYLLELYEDHGRNPRFQVPLTQGPLAAYLGTVRETLSRDLSALRKAKVISFSKKKLQIYSAKELARIAGINEERLPVLQK